MRTKLKPLHQQTIVITGASSGIGLTTARMAAERGAKVILVSRNEEALAEIAEEIREAGGKADHVAADVGKREDMKRVVDTVVERHGGFDTWVNDAGVGIYATLEETTDEDHHKIFQTNYWGVVYGSLEALRHLRERGGALINIGSISSEMPAPILSAYTASKHAVKGFTDSLRLELMHDRAPVSVTLIKPSGIHTPFGEHAKNYKEDRSQVPPPVYHPKLVARAILRAAEHPIRDITVGASGAAQIALARHMPKLADRLFSWAFYRTAWDKEHPPRHMSALHEHGHGGEQLGDQPGHVIPVSPYTRLQFHPGLVKAAALIGLAAGAVLLGRRYRNNHHAGWSRAVQRQFAYRR
jgi:short-subunit dehydrogenase